MNTEKNDTMKTESNPFPGTIKYPFNPGDFHLWNILKNSYLFLSANYCSK